LDGFAEGIDAEFCFFGEGDVGYLICLFGEGGEDAEFG
jgi:hypothetical protein